MYWTPSCVIIYKSCTLLKIVRFLAHPVFTWVFSSFDYLSTLYRYKLYFVTFTSHIGWSGIGIIWRRMIALSWAFFQLHGRVLCVQINQPKWNWESTSTAFTPSANRLWYFIVYYCAVLSGWLGGAEVGRSTRDRDSRVRDFEARPGCCCATTSDKLFTLIIIIIIIIFV